MVPHEHLVDAKFPRPLPCTMHSNPYPYYPPTNMRENHRAIDEQRGARCAPPALCAPRSNLVPLLARHGVASAYMPMLKEGSPYIHARGTALDRYPPPQGTPDRLTPWLCRRLHEQACHRRRWPWPWSGLSR
jgi:hypothetical protein